MSNTNPLGGLENEAVVNGPPNGAATGGQARLDKLISILDAVKLYIASLDADLLKLATRGIGTDERLVVEVLCSRTKLQIDQIDLIYRFVYLLTF